ncbi:MAG TPA: DoxX family membrane protein [Pseudolabrys sp.]|jgi:putative oxidoreductase|nr:DoxX family membrane protein [Pseudolabrys sp.]
MHGLYPNDASVYDTIGRLMIIAFFVIVGVRNLQRHHVEDHVKRLGIFKCPMPRQAFWAGIALEFVGCALVLINWHPAVGVICLIVFTVLATLLLLRFWEMDDPMKRMGMQNGFLANIAVVGGLLLLLQNVM